MSTLWKWQARGMGLDGRFWTAYTYVYIYIGIWAIYTYVALLIGANNCEGYMHIVAFTIIGPLLLLLLLLLLLKKVCSARLRESGIHPISLKTPVPQYQPIDRKKRNQKRVEDYSRD